MSGFDRLTMSGFDRLTMSGLDRVRAPARPELVLSLSKDARVTLYAEEPHTAAATGSLGNAT
jgi:hypothetical protein